MSYKDTLKAAKEAGKFKKLNPTFVEWKKEGQDVVGKLIDVIEVQSSLNEGSYNQYLVDTDEGMVKFALSGATDREVGALLEIGGIFYFKFLGKEKLAGGRTLKRFEVERIADLDKELGDQGEIPF